MESLQFWFVIVSLFILAIWVFRHYDIKSLLRRMNKDEVRCLTNTTFSDLIQIDNNYLTRLELRKQIIRDHHEIALQAHPTITPAVTELYTWLVTNYLPTRFPTLFTLCKTSLHNAATSLTLPLVPPLDPIQTLSLLGQNLDEDFLLLLPSPDGDGYVLRGYITCFPSGFNTREKFGQKLREIHAPVPGYAAKLSQSMDRFFSRLEVGRVVLRSNWSITTHGRLFAASGNHLYEGEEPEDEVVDIEETYLRCERQTLHRLRESKALVFAFKTYMYSIREIKEEGMGEELACAIEGLESGSVPQMMFYKRGVVWGEAVKSFLRS
ncbi:hypothetical protein N431DRAFT_476032 [Stipitochalara longipes BDJ]|nr:hypothetical protein N431DRAFT_476032 [Stipitochalara longipes BDJ]